jgi:hypothetical protein
MPKLALLDPTKTGRQAQNLENEPCRLVVGQVEAIQLFVEAYLARLQSTRGPALRVRSSHLRGA